MKVPPRLRQKATAAPLMTAIRADSLTQVQKVLASDPWAAKLPFMDHNFEPPLCYAARACVKSDIFQVLLEGGADVNATNVFGRSPLSLLCGTARRRLCSNFEPENFWPSNPEEAHRDSEALNLAQLLIHVPAWPEFVQSPDCDRSIKDQREENIFKSARHLMAFGAKLGTADGSEDTPIEQALRTKRTRLASMLQHYRAAQAQMVLQRMLRTQRNAGSLHGNIGGCPEGVIWKFIHFLAPTEIVSRVQAAAN